jgi:hypothetical protein
MGLSKRWHVLCLSYCTIDLIELGHTILRFKESKMEKFTSLVVGLVTWLALATNAFAVSWITLSVPPSTPNSIDSMTATVYFDGREGSAYDIRCNNRGPVFGGCSGTVDGQYYGSTNTAPTFSPIIGASFSFNVGSGGVSPYTGGFSFNREVPFGGNYACCGENYFFLFGTGRSFYLQVGERAVSMQNENTFSAYLSDLNAPATGPVVGYWSDRSPPNIPTPASLALFAAGLIGFIATRRKQA